MFRKLIKNKKAQNTAEYAILISLVVAGIIAMQTYAQRALQARVKDASTFLTRVDLNGKSASQYEPYYLDTKYNTTRWDETTEWLDNTQVTKKNYNTRRRNARGRDLVTFNEDMLANPDGF